MREHELIIPEERANLHAIRAAFPLTGTVPAETPDWASISEARHSGALPLTGMKWNAQPVRGGQKTDRTRRREKEEEALLH
ncbi:uncharacterized [Tachysurus ichikawai]